MAPELSLFGTIFPTILPKKIHLGILFYLLIGVALLAIGFLSMMSKLVRCYPINKSFGVRYLPERYKVTPSPASTLSAPISHYKGT